MTILFLTDSLSLPREGNTESVLYEETYPYLLKNKFTNIEFIFSGIGGATISKLNHQSGYFKGLKPNLVFIQCGIVDCAPRPFREFEKEIINKLKIRRLFKPLIHFLTKYRKYKYTKPNTFKRLLNHQNTIYFKDSKIYGIGILPACIDYEKKLPGITESIIKYNNIIKNSLNYIDNSDIPNSAILSDFHHLNKNGHKIMFEKLSKIIDMELNKN